MYQTMQIYSNMDRTVYRIKREWDSVNVIVFDDKVLVYTHPLYPACYRKARSHIDIVYAYEAKTPEEAKNHFLYILGTVITEIRNTDSKFLSKKPEDHVVFKNIKTPMDTLLDLAWMTFTSL